MAKPIVKTLNITRVTYYTVRIDPETKEPSLESHPDMVFSGLYDKEKVNRELAKIVGKNQPFVITSISSGQHRYEMDIATFVLNAKIVDEEEPYDPEITDTPEEFPEEDMDAEWGAEDDVTFDRQFE